MTMSHADHDHPATPADRAACRKALTGAPNDEPWMTRHQEQLDSLSPAKGKRTLRVEPKAGKQPAQLKRTNTTIKAEHDLADVPAICATAVRYAWSKEWPVTVGYPFNASERRFIISARLGEITIIWKTDNPYGLNRITFRLHGDPRWTGCTSLNEAITLAT